MALFQKVKNSVGTLLPAHDKIERRKFGKLALATLLGHNALLSKPIIAKSNSALDMKPNPSNLKLAELIPADLNDEEMAFMKQIGLDYVRLVLDGPADTSYENILRMRRSLEGNGLKIYNIVNRSVHCVDAITLNLPCRDEKIEEYRTFIRNLGKAGIRNTTYCHIANGIPRTGYELTRGGAHGSALDMEKVKKGEASWSWGNLKYKDFDTPTHGRVYSEDELWENYTYFIKAVVPVAEEAGVRIAIHPDDPPAITIGGIPRCIFSSLKGYQKALEIANSDNVGMCLCVGCWLEGGNLMDKDVIETIHYFGGQNKIFKVHFRNVTAPLPHFVEVFPDNGYMDMYKVMKALREVNNDCAIIPDHLVSMAGGRRASLAYFIGYMRALLERANEEVK